MNENSAIYILTGDTSSGKTTQLMLYLMNTSNVDGVFQPVVDNKRFCYLIAKKELLALESDEWESNAIVVGKYRFRKSVIQKVKEHLGFILPDKEKIIVIDEWGKMEYAGEGFEPEISQIISTVREQKTGKIIIVVRNSLLQEFITRYNFEKGEYTVLTVSDLVAGNPFPNTGLLNR